VLEQRREVITHQLGMNERWSLLRAVERQNVSYGYLCRVTTEPVGPVFFSDVVGEGFLSACPTISAAASADFVFSVENDVDGFTATSFAKVETGTFGFSRHIALIR
jgi:hypothetical protein